MRLFSILLCLLLVAGCAAPPQAAVSPPAADLPAAEPEPPPPAEPAPAPVNYIRDVADEILSGLAPEGKPDDEKILAAYRYLIETTYFADPVGLDIWRCRSGQTEPPTFLENRALSPLVFGVGSCEDFACALALLLEQMGFEALYLPGFTLSVEGEYVDHAWTLVKLSGNWYHLDSQLEQNILRGGVTGYRYFLKTDAEMITDHKWGQNLVDYRRDLAPEDAARILGLYTPPVCDTPYPQRPPEALEKPPRPDLAALVAEIEREREACGPLPELPLNVDPPVLIAQEVAAGDSRYGRSFLAGEERALYDEIAGRAEAYDLDRPVSVPAGMSAERREQIIECVLSDNPALYWLTAGPEPGEGQALRLGVAEPLSLDDVKARQAEIDAAAARLLEGITGSASRQAAEIHDRLAERIAFDKTSSLPDIGNLYGGLVRGQAVCDGYTRSYQYLLSLRGIPNAFLAGTSVRGIPHSWNAVKLADGWYYTDLTWNVPKADSGDSGPYHDYLAVSRREIDLEHLFTLGQYPAFPAGENYGCNYYVENGYAVDPARGDLIRLLAEAFVRQLEDRPPETGGVQYLEAKLLCDPEAYPAHKQRYLRGLFEVLDEMRRLAREKELPLRIEIEGETGCAFNDSMQVLVMRPRVYPVSE